MNQVSNARGVLAACRKGVTLGAIAAALLAPASAMAAPAPTSEHARASKHSAVTVRTSHSPRKLTPAAGPVVSFRAGALFSCFGAVGGINTANTANITSTLTSVTAVVTFHGIPGTFVSGQLVQSGCLKLKFFSFVVPASGTAVVTVTDLKVSNDAFVWVNALGMLQITPDVLI